MIDIDRKLLSRPRSRGFSPRAAIAILVGVTAASVGGFIGLAQLLVPMPEGTTVVEPASYADDVLSAPVEPAEPAADEASRATTEPGADRVEEAPEPPARPARPASRTTTRPRPEPTEAPDDSRHATRDGLGLDTGDPLGNIRFDRVEG